MKILLGSSLYEPNVVGGAERVVRQLASSFQALGHEVAVITTQPAGAREHRVIDGVGVHYLPVRNLYRPFAGTSPGAVRKILWRAIDSHNVLMRADLGRVLDAERPDVLNTHNLAGISVALWAEAWRRGLPIVHTLHDQYLLCHRSTMFRPPRNCLRRCLDCRLLTAPRKRAARLVAVAIGVSRFILERHREHGYFLGQPPKVIYNTALRKAPKLLYRPTAPRAFRFGFLGQIIPTKSVRELVEAFRRSGIDDAELLIAGKCDSEYARSLVHDTRADAHIRWLGYTEPEAFFPDIDVLVVPSLWNDTAPLVILESFGYGVPVLGAKRGGIPELVPPECGWLFDPDEPGSLPRALAVCRASIDRLESMRQACVTHAQRVSAEPWAEAYVDAYRTAIGNLPAQPKAPLDPI